MTEPLFEEFSRLREVSELNFHGNVKRGEKAQKVVTEKSTESFTDWKDSLPPPVIP